MLEEDLTPEARALTSTVWVEEELRRLFRERDAWRARWCDLGDWLEQYEKLSDDTVPYIAVVDVLRYMGLRDPHSDGTDTP